MHLNSSPLYLSIPSSAKGLKTRVFSEIVLSDLGHWLFIPCGFSNATLSLFLYLYSLPLRFYHCDVNVSVVILGIFQPEKVKNKHAKSKYVWKQVRTLNNFCVVCECVYAMLKIGLSTCFQGKKTKVSVFVCMNSYLNIHYCSKVWGC